MTGPLRLSCPPGGYTGPVEPDHSDSRLPGRILALDVGTHTLGLAVTDALGITAQGLETIRRRNKRTDLAALAEVIQRFQVVELVVGLPTRLSGKDSRQTEFVREFAELLRKHFDLPLHLWDERLTSAEAGRVLRASEISIRKRAGAIDRLAAQLILQNFLQARSAAGPPAAE